VCRGTTVDEALLQVVAGVVNGDYENAWGLAVDAIGAAYGNRGCAGDGAKQGWGKQMIYWMAVGVAIAVAAAAMWWLVTKGPHKREGLWTGDGEWLPRELKFAHLVASEKQFITNRPIALGAVVDRVYEKPNKQLVLVELKTRDREQTYASDVMELSAQRMAVRGQTNRDVADIGYVVVINQATGSKKALPVKLVSDEEVVRLAARREAITTGNTRATKVEIRGLCEQCGHLTACNPKLSGHGRRGE
jgi:CRISPR-associated exonuclease Cas4